MVVNDLNEHGDKITIIVSDGAVSTLDYNDLLNRPDLNILTEKEYVDNKDSQVLADAKSHADAGHASLQSQISDNKTTIDGHTSSIEAHTEALGSKVDQSYVDEGDNALQEQINELSTNTDGTVQKTYVDNQDEQLQSQIDGKPDKTYVDAGDEYLQTQINNLSTNADGTVEKTYVDAQDNATLKDAKEYADAQDLNKVDRIDGMQLSSNDYTDSDKARVQGLPTNIETVEGAETKANDALTDAKAYTDTIAADKVDKVEGKGLSDANYTQEEKDKLAGLDSSKFKGTYTSYEALVAAHPTPVEGSYAHVDAGAGDTAKMHIWDLQDGWVMSASESTEMTSAQVKTKYESNPDTNAYDNTSKAKVESLPTNVESVEGATAKANAAESAAKQYTDSELEGYLPTTGGEVSGDIVPTQDNVHSLGSELKAWRDVYIGPGSLYVNGKKVIEEVADTINIKADPDQNLAIKTSGIGNLELVSIGGMIQLKGGVIFQAGKLIRTTDGSAFLFDDSIELSAGESVISDNVTKIDGTPYLTEMPLHNHDNDYYGKGDVDTLLGDKVDSSRVLTDVPENAVFTDTVYDDTAIQQEVDNKLDKSPTVQGFWRGTQADYDALTQAEKDDNTIIRFIEEETV